MPERIGGVAENGLRQLDDVNSLNSSISELETSSRSNEQPAEQNNQLMASFSRLEDQLKDTLARFQTSDQDAEVSRSAAA